jgi:Xaa-Pro aminopeptidase
MEQPKRVRIIKGGRAAQQAEAAHVAAQPAVTPGREVREVVSDWVRDHRRRSEEFRRNYSTLLGEVGFKMPSFGGSAA